jgi:transcriptional regulator with XRE-family HTH domain
MSDDNTTTPMPADLLSDPGIRARFEEKAAALEAANLVRQMRSQALSASGMRGISQDELAQRAGLSQPRISQIEKGDGRDGLSYAVLRKLAYACGVDWGQALRDVIASVSLQATPNSQTTQTKEAPDALRPGIIHPPYAMRSRTIDPVEERYTFGFPEQPPIEVLTVNSAPLQSSAPVTVANISPIPDAYSTSMGWGMIGPPTANITAPKVTVKLKKD